MARQERTSLGGPRLEVLERRILLSAELLKDIHVSPGSLGSYLRDPVVAGDVLFFEATDGQHGRELWSTDGTEAGTHLVKDINPGSGNGALGDWCNCALGGVLLFGADDGTHGPELWRSDGTEAGTYLVRDIYPGSTGPAPRYPVCYNGAVFFRADDGVHGPEPWRSDGTEAGTYLVKDITPGADGSYPARFVEANGTLFFAAGDQTCGYELWRTDGTEAGTWRVKDIHPGGGSSDPDALCELGAMLLFRANDGEHGYELWRSDGTEAGTTLVMDIHAGGNSSVPDWLTEAGGVVFFAAFDDEAGYELWRTDGTAGGTWRVRDIWPATTGSGSPYSSQPWFLTAWNGLVLFTAHTGDCGRELWRSDGTEDGTVIVRDIRPGADDSSCSSLTPLGEGAFFEANDGLHGSELWRTDGTANGTSMVGDLNPGETGSGPDYLAPFGQSLVFSAWDTRFGVEPWILRDTSAPAPGSRVGPYTSGPTYLFHWPWENADQSVQVWALGPTGWAPCGQVVTADEVFLWETRGLGSGLYYLAALGWQGQMVVFQSHQWVELMDVLPPSPPAPTGAVEASAESTPAAHTPVTPPALAQGLTAQTARGAEAGPWASSARSGILIHGQPAGVSRDVAPPIQGPAPAALCFSRIDPNEASRLTDLPDPAPGRYVWETGRARSEQPRLGVALSADEPLLDWLDSAWIELL